MQEKICKKAAELLAGRDWHKLSVKERDLLSLLEEGGYIIKNKPANGFVGQPPK